MEDSVTGKIIVVPTNKIQRWPRVYDSSSLSFIDTIKSEKRKRKLFQKEQNVTIIDGFERDFNFMRNTIITKLCLFICME